MNSTSSYLWLSTITERIMKFRQPLGFKLQIWGNDSDLAALIFIMKMESKIWSIVAYGSHQNYESQLMPWIKKSQFSYNLDNEECLPCHTAYVQLNANLGANSSWFNEVPPGGLIISLWQLDGPNQVNAIKDELNLKQPLWSESIRKVEGGGKSLAILAYSQAKNYDL